ncbi:hypothetical protein DJ529_12490, partial [Sulfolobus sp. C3]
LRLKRENRTAITLQSRLEDKTVKFLFIFQSGSAYLVEAVAIKGGKMNSVLVIIVIKTSKEIEIIKLRTETIFLALPASICFEKLKQLNKKLTT